MADPVGMTLACVGVAMQVYEACDRLYHGYKLTQAFGSDFLTTQVELETQWARLYYLVKKRRISEREFDIADPHHGITRLILVTLSDMNKIFEECHELMAKYADTGQASELKPIDLESHREGKPGSRLRLASVPQTPQSSLHVPEARISSKWSFKGLSKRISQTSSSNTTSNTSDSSMNKTTASTAITTPSNPQTALSMVSMEREEQASSLQQKVSMIKKIAWAKEHRQRLRDAIMSLMNSNENLEKLLSLISMPDEPEDGALTLPVAHNMDNFWSTMYNVRSTVDLLHHDLKSVNRRSDSSTPFALNVRLLEDHDECRRALMTHTSVHDPSMVFNILQHSDAEGKEAAHLLIIETIWEPSPSLTDGNRRKHLETLERRESLPPIDAEATIEPWGLVSSDAEYTRQRIVHAVYHDRETTWTSESSLAKLLEDKQYQQRVKPYHINRLARLLMCSHIQFAPVRDNGPYPRPHNFRYYNDDCQHDGNFEDILSEPWLDLGFGRHPPKAKLGRSSMSTKVSSRDIVELGLLLYQIGVGATLSYGSGPQGLARAKSIARTSLRTLENRMGIVYTEIVRGLLEFPTPPAYVKTHATAQREDSFVQKSISALFELDGSMEATLLEAGSVPILPDLQNQSELGLLIGQWAENIVGGSTTDELDAIAGSAEG